MTDDFVKKKKIPKKEYNVVLMIANTLIWSQKQIKVHVTKL